MTGLLKQKQDADDQWTKVKRRNERTEPNPYSCDWFLNGIDDDGRRCLEGEAELQEERAQGH
jgi:hypothetical protein